MTLSIVWMKQPPAPPDIFSCLAANAKLAASFGDALVFVEDCHARMSVAVWPARMQVTGISVVLKMIKMTVKKAM